eukprot:390728-Heterocapsa_arctica.AAC.1
MCPIDLALSEEITFGISTQVGMDGNFGDEFWALDHCNGHVKFTGQIGVIVSVPQLLEAGIVLHKTPRGSFVITRGGCP